MGANGFAAVVGGSQAEVLAETVAEVGAGAAAAGLQLLSAGPYPFPCSLRPLLQRLSSLYT